jgi:FAD/FMN-containing dehydrogenase
VPTRREFVRLAAGAGAALLVPVWDADAVSSKALRELARAARGPLFVRGKAGFAAVAHGYNERYDAKLPRAVLVAHAVADVQAAVRWAAAHKVPIAARSGGHSYAGYSTVKDGLVVDLRHLRGIALEHANTRVVLGPGAQLGDVYARLAAHGVTIPAGTCPSVAVGGLAQGGGFGLASRDLGVTADRVMAVQIVTADGRVRHAGKRKHADLYWACRGGGGGNFGIVTAFTLRTAHAPRAAWFSVSWPWAQASAALAAWQQVMGGAPDALTSVLSLSGARHVSAVGQFRGSVARLRGLLGPLSAVAGAQLSTGSDDYGALQRRWAGCATISHAACHTVGTRPGGTLPRARFAAGSDYVGRVIPAAGRAAAIAAVQRRPTGTSMLFDAYGGAINRVAPDATAFVHRDALCSIQYLAYGDTASGAAWVKSARAAMAPYVNGEAYQNYIDPALGRWRHAYYGTNLARLKAVKAAVDPDRVFDFKQAI